MRTVIGYVMVVLGLIAFMSCSEEEEPNGPAGVIHDFYYIAISDENGEDLLSPDNSNNVSNSISFTVDKKNCPVYVHPDKFPLTGLYGAVDKWNFHDCWTLRIGGFAAYQEQTFNIDLTVKGVRYDMKIVVYHDYRTEDFKVTTSAFYINGELVDTTFPRRPIQLTIRR